MSESWQVWTKPRWTRKSLEESVEQIHADMQIVTYAWACTLSLSLSLSLTHTHTPLLCSFWVWFCVGVWAGISPYGFQRGLTHCQAHFFFQGEHSVLFAAPEEAPVLWEGYAFREFTALIYCESSPGTSGHPNPRESSAETFQKQVELKLKYIFTRKLVNLRSFILLEHYLWEAALIRYII